MPTTTEVQRERPRPRRLVSYCALALGLWFGGLLVAAVTFEPTAAVMVLAPKGRAVFASAQQGDVDFLDASGSLFTVAGRSTGFVRRLYANGAWLVLPMTEGGCRVMQQIRAQFS